MPGHRGDLIVIGGPTASGKTRVAAAVARHFSAEVVSADARPEPVILGREVRDDGVEAVVAA